MKRILLLEDDLSLGETIKELLLENDYEVDYVTKGNDVIEITFDKEYDLYIFDINVPDIDGLEILKSLRDADDLYLVPQYAENCQYAGRFIGRITDYGGKFVGKRGYCRFGNEGTGRAFARYFRKHGQRGLRRHSSGRGSVPPPGRDV